MIAYFIHRPVLVSMLLIGGCLLGTISYNRLAVELLPPAELPMLVVRVQSRQDADPHFIESQAVIPLESAIAGLEGIEGIDSYVDRRGGTLYVYYTQQSNQKYAFLKLDERVASIRGQLGNDFLVRVVRIDTEQMASRFMSLQARGLGTLDQIRSVVDEKVVTELQSIDGLSQVAVYGGREQRVEVLLDEEVLHAQGLTLAAVENRIGQSSRPRRFLGQLEEGQQRLFVNLSSNLPSLSDLEDTIVRREGSLRLGQIATVVEGGGLRESIARINGMEAVSLSLVSDRQANLLALSRSTRAAVEELNRNLQADGIELVILNDTAEPIEQNTGDIKALAVVGGLLAVGILWVFLRNLLLVAIVAAAIPISVLIAMNLFYALDITLNTLSLVGLALAVGMLLDNSIVVLENIYRQLGRKRPLQEAVITGVAQVWRPVLTTTLTTVCVFLPFVFSENFLLRLLGQQIGVSIIATLVVSMIVAMMLIPVFTYGLFAHTPGSRSRSFNEISQRHRLVQIYSLLLKSCLRYPGRTTVLAVGAFLASLLLSLALSINSPVEVELNSFDLYATMPAGMTLQSADDEARRMDARLQDIAELTERRIDVESDNLRLFFELEEDYQDIARRNLAAVKEDIYTRLDAAFPQIEFSWEQPRSGPRSGGDGPSGGRAFQRLLGIGEAGEKIVLRGSNLEFLQKLGDDLRYNLDRQPEIRDSSPGISPGLPEINLRFDRTAISNFGVQPEALAAALRGFQPQLNTSVEVMKGSEALQVVLTSTDQAKRRSEDLRQLRVATVDGGEVPLRQLADLVYTRGYGGFNRVNQQKEVELNYTFEGEITAANSLLEEARTAVELLAADFPLPPGMAVEVQHDETDLTEFYFLFGASVLLIYMILAAVFESLVAPLAMMITLPLATIGALWGLILTGNSIFNANALVGFLILLGVVVNNGIMLIDYARLLQRQGYRLGRALLAAGQIRVRPILITALSTILAMLPLAMGNAEYVATIGAPFAIAVIGGLIAGTIFTLVLVPTVYFGLATTVAWIGQLDWKINLLQLAGLCGGAVLIYYKVDSAFWQFADGIVLLGLVPALTWFALSSLRRSRSALIPVGVPLHISLGNVTKVYDERSRFARQWGRGQRQAAHRREATNERDQRRAALAWRLPLLAFHFYFVYLYLESGVWTFILSVAFSLHFLNLTWIWLPRSGGFLQRSIRLLYQLAYWLLPLAHLLWFRNLWDNMPLIYTIGALWYLAASINRGLQRLHGGKVNVDAITGRLRRSRRTFYLLLRAIPFIGKRKHPFTAVKQVSLEIESGMFGLVGPNGAGKTTLMRIVSGILEQSQGKIRINGIDLAHQREELQALIGYLPQEFGTYENMNAGQFLDYQALLKGNWDSGERHKVVQEALRSVHLEESRNAKIGSFSGGMKQRVGIAQTLLRLPRILLVDEPTAGLDPRERIRFRNLLAELARDRIVIFSTHIIEDISSSCNRLAVMGESQIRFQGSPQEMVDLTRGAVWQAQVDEARMKELHLRSRIVHHMQDGELIRVRLLAAEQPLPEAHQVTPTLEDAYLWLLEGQA